LDGYEYIIRPFTLGEIEYIFNRQIIPKQWFNYFGEPTWAYYDFDEIDSLVWRCVLSTTITKREMNRKAGTISALFSVIKAVSIAETPEDWRSIINIARQRLSTKQDFLKAVIMTALPMYTKEALDNKSLLEIVNLAALAESINSSKGAEPILDNLFKESKQKQSPKGINFDEENKRIKQQWFGPSDQELMGELNGAG